MTSNLGIGRDEADRSCLWANGPQLERFESRVGQGRVGDFLAELLLDTNMDPFVASNQLVFFCYYNDRVFRPSSTPGTVSGKVLAANYTGQVFMWADFNFVAPYHFQYDDYPNDFQKIVRLL